jgi:hypothetical protein
VAAAPSQVAAFIIVGHNERRRVTSALVVFAVNKFINAPLEQNPKP